MYIISTYLCLVDGVQIIMQERKKENGRKTQLSHSQSQGNVAELSNDQVQSFKKKKQFYHSCYDCQNQLPLQLFKQ